MPLASSATSATIGLIVTFGGVGILANALIVYIAAQILGERQDNRRDTGA